jgi:hypothetical protein
VTTSLDDLQRIAEVEFATLMIDSQPLGEKLRLFLTDGSYVDLWLSRKLSDRFGFHWERRHVDGTCYRYDNFPNTAWRSVDTYPYHFHNGSQDAVEAAPFAADLLSGFRDFMRFVQAKLVGQSGE